MSEPACNGLLQYLAFGQRRVAHAKQISELVYDIDGMLVLDFWHPANRFPDVMSYYTTVVLLHQGLYPC